MADSFAKELGKRIRIYRRMNRLTQEAVGARLGISGAQIGHYEIGNHRLSFHLAWQLKKLFHISFDDLLTEENRSYKTLADIAAEFDFGKHAMLHKYFDRLTPHHKSIVVQLAKDLAMTPEENPNKANAKDIELNL